MTDVGSILVAEGIRADLGWVVVGVLDWDDWESSPKLGKCKQKNLRRHLKAKREKKRRKARSAKRRRKGKRRNKERGKRRKLVQRNMSQKSRRPHKVFTKQSIVRVILTQRRRTERRKRRMS